MHDFIIGNEPNLNRFWLPQFGPNGDDVAAPAYEQLLATTYDALKALRPHSTIYGGALAPRGVDKPGTGRDTHSPDCVHHRPRRRLPGERSRAPDHGRVRVPSVSRRPRRTGPNFPHPNSTSIGLADYAKLVGLLGAAFDGTAQHGSTLPILYDEFGIETQIPAAKAPLYIGTEPATTKPVDEATQAQMYLQAMQMTFCQPTVLGLMLFHVQDEPVARGLAVGRVLRRRDAEELARRWSRRAATSRAPRDRRRRCPGLHLTPKVTARSAGRSTKTLQPVTLTCSLDCTYIAASRRRASS